MSNIEYYDIQYIAERTISSHAGKEFNHEKIVLHKLPEIII